MEQQASAQTVILTSRNCAVKQLDANTADYLSYVTSFHEGRTMDYSASDDTETELLSNYHVKTLMLWAYELKPKSWWIDETSVVKICVELLHMLTGWLTDEYCPRYFINSSCDLLNLYDASHSTESSSSSMSVTD